MAVESDYDAPGAPGRPAGIGGVKEPTGDQCDARQIVEVDGEKYLATWYPQMGGYSGKCLVSISPGEGCFDVFVWHDGEFPFSESEQPSHLHHCSAEQFVRFGEEVLEAQRTYDDAGAFLYAKNVLPAVIRVNTARFLDANGAEIAKATLRPEDDSVEPPDGTKTIAYLLDELPLINVSLDGISLSPGDKLMIPRRFTLS